jgi:hypothetical protein
VRHAPATVADDRGALKREFLTLVGLMLLVDAVFIGVHYAAGLRTASGDVRVGYTVLWTAVTLVVALRGLRRIRAARLRLRSQPPS